MPQYRRITCCHGAYPTLDQNIKTTRGNPTLPVWVYAVKCVTQSICYAQINFNWIHHKCDLLNEEITASQRKQPFLNRRKTTRQSSNAMRHHTPFAKVKQPTISCCRSLPTTPSSSQRFTHFKNYFLTPGGRFQPHRASNLFSYFVLLLRAVVLFYLSAYFTLRWNFFCPDHEALSAARYEAHRPTGKHVLRYAGFVHSASNFCYFPDVKFWEILTTFPWRHSIRCCRRYDYAYVQNWRS